MADQHNDNIPAIGNQIASDIPNIKENLEYHKDIFENFVGLWNSTTATGIYPAKWYSKAWTYSDGAILDLDTHPEYTFLEVDTSGGAIHIDLPTPATVGSDHYHVVFLKTAGNTLTIDADTNGSATIAGDSNIDLATAGQALFIACDGSNWQVLFSKNVTIGTITAVAGDDLVLQPPSGQKLTLKEDGGTTVFETNTSGAITIQPASGQSVTIKDDSGNATFVIDSTGSITYTMNVSNDFKIVEVDGNTIFLIRSGDDTNHYHQFLVGTGGEPFLYTTFKLHSATSSYFRILDHDDNNLFLVQDGNDYVSMRKPPLISAAYRPTCKLYLSSNQTENAGLHKIDLDSAVANHYPTSLTMNDTANKQIDLPWNFSNSIWYIHGVITWSATTDQNVYTAQIRVGGTIFAESMLHASGTGELSVNVSTMFYGSNTYVELYAIFPQNETVVGDPQETYLEVMKVA